MIEVENIRNIVVTGHAKAGKTSLVEAILHNSGAINRLGKVEEGTTITDYEPEEIDRQISLSSALAFCQWKDHRINIIDTPGFINFLEDTKGSMRAADGVVLMISALSGIKGETEKIWGFATDFNLPVVAFVNKMDKESADFQNALDGIKSLLNTEPLPLQMPIGEAQGFNGVVDLLDMKAYTYADGKATEGEVPADIKDRADELRNVMIERVAEADDELLEKYLEGGELSRDEIVNGIKAGTIAKQFVPVTCGAPNLNIGIKELMDAVTMCLPSPVEMAGANPIKGINPKDDSEAERKPSEDEPFSAYVFKTVADPFSGKLSFFRILSGKLAPDSSVMNASTDNKERIGQVFYLQGKKHENAETLTAGEIAVVAKLKGTSTGDTLCDASDPIRYETVKFAEPLISYAIAPKSKGDADKVGSGLHRILEEDSSLDFHMDEEAHEMILAGMGQLHLEVTLDKLKRKFGVEVEMKSPKIPYRETITIAADAKHKHKKQSGGKGQYGECAIRVEPLPRGSEYEFENKIVGGAIPRGFIPAVDKGIQKAINEGIYAGYKMVDLKVSLYDGSYHAVDSSEMAFKIAGSMAIKKAVEQAKPIVLEPVMNVNITVPDEFLGTVIGDLNGRRGKVQGMDQAPNSTNQKVSAAVPMAEMLTYANQLQSMTAGRGIYTMEFSHYDPLPKQLTQRLLEEKAAQEEEK
ncbi:MAG: elongation factor G [Thermodesulfovibrionales bacterium]|nr:elongation factor G [Thermodesulfovibrionales bacterium]